MAINSNIYLVTDPLPNLLLILKKYVDLDIGFVQYRNKNCSDDFFVAQANQIAKICQFKKTKLIINDRIHLLSKINCDGFHVGQSDGEIGQLRQQHPKKIIGVSVHNYKEALAALKADADILGVGAIFPTETKLDATMVSLETLKKINSVQKSIAIIGGINDKNILQVNPSLYQWIAFSSFLLKTSNPKTQLEKIQLAINNAKQFFS